MNKIHPIALLSVFLNLILILVLAHVVGKYPYAIFDTTEAFNNRQPKASAEKLFELVQNWRTENGYNKYTLDKILCGYANQRAHELNNDFSHDAFDPYKYITNFSYVTVSENIVRVFDKTAQVYNFEKDSKESIMLDWWLHSPKHLEALRADHTNSCVACYNDNCVQLFANFQSTK